MRQIMAEASVGDDVMGEDPSVNRLQQLAAARLGKEAALFVVSGTMGNLLALLSHARSGQEVIVDALSHIFASELGGAAALGGIQLVPVTTERGVLIPSQMLGALHSPTGANGQTSAAVCVEDTHNRHGGVTWPLTDLRALWEAARSRRVAVHIDGARLFNAAVAQGIDARDIAGYADTVTFCLSKGLGAPVGSVLCGPADFIERARWWRKMLGGGWREAGVLAAAGLFALDANVNRLADDHANARRLAEGLARLDGLTVDLSRVETNIVLFEPDRVSVPDLIARLRARNVLASRSGDKRLRFVTHLGVDGAAIASALAATAEAIHG